MDQPRLPDAFLGELLRLKGISALLLEDVLRSHELAVKHAANDMTDEVRLYGQFLLRCYVRTFFAHVDGVTYAMRESLLDLHSKGHVALSPAEHCLLSESRYVLDEGKPKRLLARNSALDAMRFSFSQFASGFSSPFVLNTADPRWTAFRDSLKVRHGVTHPKQVGDLFLSPDAIRQFGDAIGWFSDQMANLLQSCLDRT